MLTRAIDKEKATVLTGGTVLTMDCDDRLIQSADIRIVGRRITAIGDAGSLARPGDQVIDCRETLITPGFVNTHTHACAALFRGLCEDLPRSAWRDGYSVRNQGRFQKEDYLLSAQASAYEFLMNGVTCIADRWGGYSQIPEVLEDSGIRAVFGYTLTDIVEPADWKSVDGLVERWGTASENRISTGIAPHAPDTCSDELLRTCADRAGELGCRVFLHLAQSVYEIERLRARGYPGAIACMKANGLAAPTTVAAHCIYLSEDELSSWGEHGISVAHCPGSNLKIEARTPPIHRLIGKAALGIGTDWTASDNAMDMLFETRLAAMIAKREADDPEALPIVTMLRCATIDGARALGLDTVIGSIEVGKYADIVVFDLSEPEANPRYNLRANLLYSMSTRCVRDVMVDGRLLVRNRLLDHDLNGLRKELARRAPIWAPA